VTGLIAVFLPSLVGGGAERSLLHVAVGLAERFDIDVVLARREGPLLDEVPDHITLVDLGASRTAGAVVPLARYLRRARPSGMISGITHGNIVALVAARLARTATPVVVSEQSHLTTGVAHAVRARDRLTPMLMRRVYPWAATVAAVSHGVADDLVHGVGLAPGSVTVAYNPVLADDLEHRAGCPLDHPWFGTGQPPVVLAIGRLTAQKDFPSLLHALALVRVQRDVRAVILGEGEDRGALEALVGRLGLEGAVDMPGFVENPYPFFRAADLLALSSRWEGLPTVLLEALALGTPIVATDCPSGPREILEDGALGELVPMEAPPAMATAIIATLDRRRPDPCRQSISAYELPAVAERYAALLHLPKAPR
jgi:glycosyltransferase involved in cell wall biosynthesis